MATGSQAERRAFAFASWRIPDPRISREERLAWRGPQNARPQRSHSTVAPPSEPVKQTAPRTRGKGASRRLGCGARVRAQRAAMHAREAEQEDGDPRPMTEPESGCIELAGGEQRAR